MDFIRIYGRVLGLLAPERGLAIALALANVALAALFFVEPVLFGKVVDVLVRSQGQPAGEVWRQTLVLLGIWAGVGLAGIVANIVVALHADRLAHRNRLTSMARYFDHVLALPHAFHGASHSGRVLKVMLTGADHLFGLWLAFFREHLSTFVAVVVLLPLSLFLNWQLGLLLVVLVIFFAILTAIVIGKTNKAQGEVEACHSELAMRAGDALGNVPVIHSFVRRAAEARQIGAVIDRVLAAQYPVLNLWAIVSVLTRSASTITIIAIFVVGTWLNLNGKASVGAIVSFMGFAQLLIGRLEQAVGFVSRMFFQMPALAEYFSILDTESTVKDRADAIELTGVRGDIAFDRVTFAYGSVRPALVDLTFSVAAGQTVALVGTTGAGKSTAVSLLMRQADPQEGSIRIDGRDIRDVTVESLRRNIGVVFQDSMLFSRSIADNLRVGNAEAGDEELVAAAKQAEAYDFIMTLPDGFDTVLGERGAGLSGGERQRLAIARALLKDPPILILDEATSALDAETEAKVQRALKKLLHGRTTFIIAHRLSTVRDADMILVFRDGRIVERGGFDELVGAGGVFSRLVATQLDRPAEATARPAAE